MRKRVLRQKFGKFPSFEVIGNDFLNDGPPFQKKSYYPLSRIAVKW